MTTDQPRKGSEAPDPMSSDVGRPEPVNETAGKGDANPTVTGSTANHSPTAPDASKGGEA